MTILVTGSSGQVGSNLVARLLADGLSVVGVDMRPNPWLEGFPTLLVDLRDASADKRMRYLLGHAERPSVVIHLAAHAKVHQLVLEPMKAYENIAMLRAAAELARLAGAPLVLASSREVYGNRSVVGATEHLAAPDAQRSVYAASKLACESMAMAYHHSYGIPVGIVRLSNVYGRYDHDHDRLERIVPLCIQRIGAGEPIALYGRDKLLDFTHVDDCVDGIARLVSKLTNGQLASGTFNIASGQGNSLQALTQVVSTLLGRSAQIRWEGTRLGEVVRYVADLSKARQILDYRPRYNLEQGIARCLGERPRTGTEPLSVAPALRPLATTSLPP